MNDILQAAQAARLRVDHIRRQIVDGQAVALDDVETLQSQIVTVENMLEAVIDADKTPKTQDRAGTDEAEEAGALT